MLKVILEVEGKNSYMHYKFSYSYYKQPRYQEVAKVTSTLFCIIHCEIALHLVLLIHSHKASLLKEVLILIPETKLPKLKLNWIKVRKSKQINCFYFNCRNKQGKMNGRVICLCQTCFRFMRNKQNILVNIQEVLTYW